MKTTTAAVGEEESLQEYFLRVSPSWLASMVFHLVLLIVLALFAIVPEGRLGIELFSRPLDEMADALEDASLDLSAEAPSPIENVAPQLQELSNPLNLLALQPISPDPILPSNLMSAPTISKSLLGREGAMKARLRKEGGGNAQTDAAVKLGLKWLARQQRPNGSWSLQGPYANAAQADSRSSATAMALLAFQGDGYTHQRGEYQAVVHKGIQFLISQQNDNGNFFRRSEESQTHYWLYSHAQATIAVCELYAMSKDSKLRGPAEKAVDFCVKSQASEGGWRYQPRRETDTSVTGWMLMALQSARMAGIKVPKETLSRVSGYLDSVTETPPRNATRLYSVTDEGVLYSYLPGPRPTNVMTAEALLCRQYLGWKRSDGRLRQGAEYLLAEDNLPDLNDRDAYYWYYASQMLHHMGRPYWPKWNDAMWPLLVRTQEKQGPEAGSWHPNVPEPDAWGDYGGRLYVTCLAIYVLEVYYRHLPLYGDVFRGEVTP